MFSITRNELTSLASVGHLAGRDDLTPVLTLVQITADPEARTVTATATNRYVVGEIVLTEVHFDEGAERAELLVDSRWLLDAAKAVKGRASEGRMPVVVSREERSDGLHNLRITNYDVTLETGLQQGNYPNVSRLFPEDMPESVDGFAGWALSPKNLAALAKVIPPTAVARDVADTPFKLTPTKSTEKGESVPVLVTRGRFEGFRGLIQPNRVL